MDICVLNPLFYPDKGGTENVLLEMYSRMAKKHNVTIICANSKGSGKEKIEELNGMRIVRLRTKNINAPLLPMHFPLMMGLNGAIRREKADIYHVNNRYVYYPTTIRTLMATGKFALTIHNSLPKDINLITNLSGWAYDAAWGRKMMHYADIITGVSRYALDVTVPRKDIAKSHVVFNGVDFRRFRKYGRKNAKVVSVAESLDLKGSIMMNNARFVPQKGQLWLISAVSRLVSGGYDLSLLLVGSGPMHSKLQNFAESKGLEGRFAIRSGIEIPDLPYYFNSASAFVFPSLYEPAGLALLEALACEVPSMASRIGGIPEMMKGCGRYLRPRSSSSIANSIKKTLESETESSRFARNGRKLMKREHDWDKIIMEYDRLFESVIHY